MLTKISGRKLKDGFYPIKFYVLNYILLSMEGKKINIQDICKLSLELFWT